MNPEQWQADARLIAAAPEMLEALEAALALLDKQRAEYNSTLTILPHAAVSEGPIAKQARAAIAKAHGEQEPKA